MKFVLENAEDESVDDDYKLLDDDDKDTGISIQDCRSYAGVYAVNRYYGEGRDFRMCTIGEAKTLVGAKRLALLAATE